MDAPVNRGLAWYRYKALEEEFISATKYFPFEKSHKDIWSEFFSDLLTKTGSSIDSFFQNMLKDKGIACPYPHIQQLLASNRKKDNIYFFKDCFESIYALSGAEVDIAYGLTLYDTKVRPFAEFGANKIPSWWTAYNHVKHTWFQHIEEATLECVINALAGLFLLNVLNSDSRVYLLKNQNVIRWDYMDGVPEATKIELAKTSKIGFPRNWSSHNFTASTPVFVHTYRIDQNSSYG